MTDPTIATTSDSTEKTRYVILHQDDSGYWTVVETMGAAPSADAAIRKHLKGDAKPTGTFVAVPARSWKPVTVSAVQTTVLKLDAADASPL